jgi:hypothetical protein
MSNCLGIKRIRRGEAKKREKDKLGAELIAFD